jgi:hypothetical protein
VDRPGDLLAGPANSLNLDSVPDLSQFHNTSLFKVLGCVLTS